MSKFHPLTVSKIERLTPDSVCVSFYVPTEKKDAFKFLAGQYLTLKMKVSDKEVRRAYSICSSISDDELSVGIRKVEGGVFSTFVNDELSVGDIVDVMTPEGRFIKNNALTKNHFPHYLCIAAGSGITPMLSLLKSGLSEDASSTYTLVYGNRESASAMFLEQLEDLKNMYLGRFNIVYMLSREVQDVALFNGRIDKKSIGSLIDANLISPNEATQIFICGPDQMIDGCEQALSEARVEMAKISTERFTSSNDAVNRKPTAATVAAVKDGVQVSVVLDGLTKNFSVTDPESSILDAASKAGLDLPFSCAGGMCATCRCQVVEGEVEMAVNYSLEPWELEKGFVLACQARPQTKKVVLDFDAS